MKLAFLCFLLAHLSLCGAEELDGPPVTTARAWAIAEAGSGAIVASEHGDEPMKSASTTKIMCAMVVLDLAQETPVVLEEMVTISRLADNTQGSTAGVKAGERLTVHEALYGLLLPSGNDIGNALAEHFNARLKAPGPESPPKLADAAYKTRRNFVAEMNRTAVRLGMKSTRYHLPYGDGGDAEDRTTTAHDLIRLACEAMKKPLMRQIVRTPEFSGSLHMISGEVRKMKWQNSNRLLKLDDYDGIKTGWTTSARACLVAQGEHQGRRLIVVVLGSAADESRYADARNLFRWAWKKGA